MNGLKRIWTKMVWGLALLAALGIIAGGILYAKTKTITWTLPTTRADGTALAVSELTRSNLYCGPDLANFVFIAETPAPIAQLVQDFAIGTHLCAMTVVDIQGLESDFSNVITIVVLAAKPSPPVLDQP